MLQKALYTAVVVATASASMNASAIGRIADVTIVDRSTGQTLPVHFYRGEYWVAGTPGAKYSVSVANATGGRVLSVISVDGVNVLDGKTANTNQSGYVFNRYQKYEINGWRKSNQEVAAFEFVASPSSYAERTGRPENVGVIGVALFKERVYQPPVSVYSPPPRPSSPYLHGTDELSRAPLRESGAADGAKSQAMPAPASPPAASQPSLSGAIGSSANAAGSAKRAEARGDAAQDSVREKLGTGHGEREWSQVSQTTFERAGTRPNETITVRYDSRENLVAMGVIPEPRRHQPRTPNPFPDNLSFVPDPPRYWR